jgi:hypothetical protein
VDAHLQSRTPQHGHWRRTPEAAFGQRCVTLLLLVPMVIGGITGSAKISEY